MATVDKQAITPSTFDSWEEWCRQGLLFTEAVRGGPLVWPAGAAQLHGDVLGPTRHVHDDAAEYYFIVSGACKVEVGGEERIASAGDLVYIPADAPHNLLHEVGGDDMWALILVAPNHAENKWRLDDFRPGSDDLRMAVSRPLEGDNLAESHPFPAELLELERGAPHWRIAERGELVGLVVGGTAHVRAGLVSGNLGSGAFVHVRRDLEFEASATSATASILLFECAYANFQGAPLADGSVA